MFSKPLLLALGVSCVAAAPILRAAETAEATPPAHVPSALAWDKTRIELKAELGDQRVEVAFPFRNKGSKVVAITSVSSSCGCTTTQLAKKTYAPGEQGEVRALFEFGDRTGPQQKVVTVATDDSEVSAQLVLRIDIPEALVMDQRIVQWPHGAPAETKTITIHTPAKGVVVESLDFDASQVDATLEALPGGGYRVKLRPLNTAEPLRQTVQVRAKVGELPRTLPLYIYVR